MYLLSKAVRIRSRWENALTKNRADSFVHESLVHKHLPVNVYFGFHQSHKRSSHNSNSSGEITGLFRTGAKGAWHPNNFKSYLVKPSLTRALY